MPLVRWSGRSPPISPSEVVGTNFPLDPVSPLLGGSWGLYLQENAGPEPSYRLLTVSESLLPAQSRSDRFSFVAASSGMQHVVFESDGAQLTADPLPASGRAVYEWVDGQVRFVSKLPSGEVAGAGLGGSGSSAGQFFPGSHVVSDDGERIYFIDGGANAPAPLYVREGGTQTRAVSASERATDDPTVAQPATFFGAKSDDGSLALFTSLAKLTDDATACDTFCPGVEPMTCISGMPTRTKASA